MPQIIDLTGESPPTQDRREGIQQPGQPNAITHRPANELGLNPSLGGGAEVRICNPCVPDPNNEPPPQRGHQRNPTNSRHLPAFGPQVYNPLVNNDVFSSNSIGDLNPRDPWSSVHLDRATFADRTRSRPGFRPYDLTYSTVSNYPHEDPGSLPSFQNLSFNNDEGVAGAARDGIATRERSADNSRMTSGRDNSSPARNSSNSAGSRASRPMSLDGSLPFPGFAPTATPDVRDLAYIPRGISYAGSGRYHPSASNPSIIPPRGTPPTYTPQGSSSSAPARGSHHGPPRHHRPMPSTGSAYQPRVRSMLDVDDAEPTTPSPLLPGPTLREEDYCPICQAVLPPPRPDGNEKAREAHIENCIQVSFYGSHSTLPTTSAHQQPLATSNASSSSQALGPTSTPPTGGGIARPRRGTVGRMVTFLATEKDCVGEGGEGIAECIICFEDIEVGVEMARLECLCKFHKACVRKWWDTKGPGACPVHQDNGF